MDSNTLLSIGFCMWKPFQKGIEKLAPENKGVYAYRSLTSLNLKVGASDIMYIGRAMGAFHHIKRCLNEYLHPGRSNWTKLRIHRRALTERWQVSWLLTDSPDQMECDLLRRFYSEHGQLPKENKRWPPWAGFLRKNLFYPGEVPDVHFPLKSMTFIIISQLIGR